jgi:hypothetical protein
VSQPSLLQNQYTNGMRRDSARNQLPRDAAWTLRDVILDYGAPARERGGWAYASPSMTSVTAGTASNSIRGGLYAVYSLTGGATGRNLVVDEDGNAYIFTDSGVTFLGAGVTLLQNPVFHGGAAASASTAVYTGLAIIPDGTGAAVPKKYDGNTLSNLNGSPPKARYATVYKDYTLLGNGTVDSIVYPNRVWYSPPGDPDCFGTAGISAWDTTDSWIDFIQPVRGLASMKNVHLVFGDTQVARVQGSVAPPDTDFTVTDPWQRVGLLDARSITEYQDNVFWCAPEGVFRTDGVTLDDLTQKGGMLRYWLDTVASATTAYSFSTGVIRGKLLISILNNGTFVDGFMIDLTTYSWTQMSNVDAYTYWDGVQGTNRADETFFGRAGTSRVAAVGSMFAGVASSAYKADGDGTAVACVVETPYYEAGDPGLKVWKALYVAYALVDFGSDNPTIAVGYVDTPEGTSYTSLGTLSEQAEYDRRRLRIGGRHHGMAFKFTRSGAGDFLGYSIGADVTPLEGSKLT